jgi:hypothetical protein
MNADNRHTITITGSTLREISQKAMQIFDKFFAREIEWQVTWFDSSAEIVTLRDGAGQTVAEREVTWTATLEAEASGVFIGVRREEAAIWWGSL